MSTLYDFLLDAFSSEELRRFVAYLPGGHALTPHLPGPNASLASVAEETLRLLQRKERLDGELEAALIRARPNHERRIRALFVALGKDPAVLGVGPAPAYTRVNVDIGTVSGGKGVQIGHQADAAVDVRIDRVEGGEGVDILGPKRR